MKPSVLCIVGPSNSGKTLVGEALIRHLSAKGYRIAAAKHCSHGYSLDVPGSDSARLKAAGAARVAVVSRTEWALLDSAGEGVALEQIAEQAGVGCDLLLAEGFRASTAPKVLVLPENVDPTWEFPHGVIAVVSDIPLPEAPWQCSFKEADRLADFIINRFLKPKDKQQEVSLVVEGKAIPLNAFASSLLANTLLGMLKSLKGVPSEPSSLRLEIKGSSNPLER